MENSPTGESSVAPASNEPTGQAPVDNTAEQNQEAISREQSQEAASDDTAQQQPKQTQQTGGEGNDDDGLAKFAKSQGFDPEKLTDNERRALKIAHDNQKAYRSKAGEGKKITDTTKTLGGDDLESRVQQMEYERTADNFFSDGRDRTLESTMVEILNEKTEQYGKDYAFGLSRDLDTLYGMAQLRAGQGSSVDTDAIRREERESIKRAQNASAGQPHAVSQSPETPGKIDRAWLESQYNPSNPEHRKAVDEALARGDLY